MRHAVVVGGSLAGLNAAPGLQRDGWRVTVLDRTRHPPRSGSGIGVDRRLLPSTTGVDGSILPVVNVGFPATAWDLLHGLLSRAVARRSSIAVRSGVHVWEARADGRHGAVVAPRSETSAPTWWSARTGTAPWSAGSVAPQHPDARYGGYLLWRGLVHEPRAGDLTGRDVPFAVHTDGCARFVTFAVPGPDGDLRPGFRRASFTWFDRGRSRLLREAGRLKARW